MTKNVSYVSVSSGTRGFLAEKKELCRKRVWTRVRLHSGHLVTVVVVEWKSGKIMVSLTSTWSRIESFRERARKNPEESVKNERMREVDDPCDLARMSIDSTLEVDYHNPSPRFNQTLLNARNRHFFVKDQIDETSTSEWKKQQSY